MSKPTLTQPAHRAPTAAHGRSLRPVTLLCLNLALLAPLPAHAGPAKKSVAPPAASAPAAAPTGVGDLYVAADQADGAIFLDGTDTGQRVPALLSGVAPGPHAVEVRTTCARASASVTTAVDEVARVELTLVPGTASLAVRTEPAGAHVYIDGVLSGDAPISSKDVSCGEHQLEVRLVGYLPTTRTVQAPAYEVSTVQISMAKEQFGKLTVVPTPMESIVEVDGVVLGAGPRTLDSLTVGSHEVLVRGDGYAPVRQSVEVETDKVTKLNVVLLPGEAPRPPSRVPRYALNTGVGLGGVALGAVSVANYLQGAEAYERFLATPDDDEAARILSDEVNPSQTAFIGSAVGAGLLLAGSSVLWITTDFGGPTRARGTAPSQSGAPGTGTVRERRIDGVAISCRADTRIVQQRLDSGHEAGCVRKGGGESVKDGMWVVWPGSRSEHLIYAYAEGERHGQYTRWANLDRKVEEGQFERDKQNGTWKTWDNEGRLTRESAWVDGERHGEERIVTESGVVESVTYFRGAQTGPYSRKKGVRPMIEGSLVGGKREGLFREYNEEGLLTSEINYSQGIRSGTSTTYWLNQKPMELTTYIADKPAGAFTKWYENGQMSERGATTTGGLTGQHEVWTTTGVLTEKGVYSAGKPAGPMERWTEKGVKTFEGGYAGDKTDGKVTVWSDAGVLLSRCTYIGAQKNDLCEAWYADGKPKERGAWVLDVPDGEHRRWRPGGNDEFRKTYDHGVLSGSFTEWNTGGIKTSSGSYLAGKRTGVWTFWEEGGALREKWRYDDDERVEFMDGSPEVVVLQRAEAAAKREAERSAKAAAEAEARVRAAEELAARKKADAEASRQAGLLARVEDCVDQVVRANLKWSPDQATISRIKRIPEPPQGMAKKLVELTAMAGGLFGPVQKRDDIGFMGYLAAVNGFNAKVAGGFGIVFRNADFADGYCPSAVDFWICDDQNGCDYVVRAARNSKSIGSYGF